MAYIKLGPLGDYFGSSRIGLYLNEYNAAEVDDNLLHTRLKNFLLTGFIIIIDKFEYDNIKIDQRTYGNLPLQVVGVHTPLIIEPIESVLNEPPLNPIEGQRHLVWPAGTGLWSGRRDTIAEFDGDKWIFHTPKDGWTVPVYALGISMHYIGHYPSGYWDITEERIIELETIIIGPPEDPTANPNDWATRPWVLDRIGDEADARAAYDQYLLGLIMAIQTTINTPNASQIPVEDVNNYFTGTNVELVLQELGAMMQQQGQGITLINQTIATIQQQIQNIINSLGQTQNRAIVFLNTNQINFNHNVGSIPIWNLYEVNNPATVSGNAVTSTTELSGVVAQPNRLTFTNIRFTFSKNYTLVLVLNK